MSRPIRYLLDTNVVSEATKPEPAARLTDWLAEQEDANLHISTLTLAEILRGILAKPKGRKRAALEAWFAGPEGPQALFRGRVLAFDEPAALGWAHLMAQGSAAGSPRSPLDMIVASIAVANGLVVVTGNDEHYRGVVDYLNPLALG